MRQRKTRAVGSGNVRRANGSRRTNAVKRLRAMARPCHICGLPIDYSLRPGSPESFECDELVPVSFGGSPYDPDNLAAAHRCCNNWRSNRSVGYAHAVAAGVIATEAPRNPQEFVAAAKRAEKKGFAALGAGKVETTTAW